MSGEVLPAGRKRTFQSPVMVQDTQHSSAVSPALVKPQFLQIRAAPLRLPKLIAFPKVPPLKPVVVLRIPPLPT